MAALVYKDSEILSFEKSEFKIIFNLGYDICFPRLVSMEYLSVQDVDQSKPHLLQTDLHIITAQRMALVRCLHSNCAKSNGTATASNNYKR